MRSKLGILVTVCAAVLAINLDTTIVNVALPSISSELDANTRQLQWIVDGYNLAFAALVLAAGSLSDRYGRRPALILGLIGFAAASVAGALSTSGEALVVSRFAMGTFAAVIFPTTLSIISNTFRDRKERAAALGVWGAVVGFGVAAGPVTGGLLLEHFYWGSVFWALVPLALVAAAGGIPDRARVARPERAAPRLPRPRALGRACCRPSSYTIIEAPENGWSSTETLSGFVDQRGPARRLRRRGAAEHPPDARRDAVQGPALQRGERRGDRDVLRAVRLHLPDHAVHAVHPRLGHAVDRRPHPARRPEHRGRFRRRCDAGSADRDPRRGDHGAGPVRNGVPVDLQRRRRHVVPDRDRPADGDDGARHGLHLDAGDRVDPARAAAGAGGCRVRRQRCDARARWHARCGRGRLDLLLGVRRPPGRLRARAGFPAVRWRRHRTRSGRPSPSRPSRPSCRTRCATRSCPV